MGEARYIGEDRAQLKMLELYCKGFDAELLYDDRERVFVVRWQEDFIDLENK